jgi:hypothetical protein
VEEKHSEHNIDGDNNDGDGTENVPPEPSSTYLRLICALSRATKLPDLGRAGPASRIGGLFHLISRHGDNKLSSYDLVYWVVM